jgi:hypothetical protein
MREVFKTTKYLEFHIAGDTGKTKTIFIYNIRHSEVIGEIKWYSAWRQYCFYPNHSTIWNIDCLNAVNLVITELMNDRKPKGKVIGVVANSTKDFQDWRISKFPEGQVSKDTVRKFVLDDNTYVCLSKPTDCCGWSFDEITETSNSGDNKFECKILESARPTLKPKGIWFGLQT